MPTSLLRSISTLWEMYKTFGSCHIPSPRLGALRVVHQILGVAQAPRNSQLRLCTFMVRIRLSINRYQQLHVRVVLVLRSSYLLDVIKPTSTKSWQNCSFVEYLMPTSASTANTSTTNRRRFCRSSNFGSKSCLMHLLSSFIILDSVIISTTLLSAFTVCVFHSILSSSWLCWLRNL